MSLKIENKNLHQNKSSRKVRLVRLVLYQVKQSNQSKKFSV